MQFRNTPIRRKLMTMILLTSGLVLLLTTVAFLAYDVYTFRRASVRQLATLGQVLASNSTAALAFDNPDDARETLAALQAEPHIDAAILFNAAGAPFAHYPEQPPAGAGPPPPAPAGDGFRFERSHLLGFTPVILNGRRLGTLYLQADLGALYARFRLYGGIALLVMSASLAVAYLLSRRLQQQVSRPILALAEVATAISERQDYAVRAPRLGEDELGLLTDAFNQMLARIQEQNRALTETEARTRAVLDSALTAVIVTDGAGLIIDWNARAEGMFGLARTDALARTLEAAIVPEESRAVFQSAFRDAAANGNGIRPRDAIETTARSRDRGAFPVELAVSPLSTDGIVTFCSFLTDITQRKRAEDGLRESEQNLATTLDSIADAVIATDMSGNVVRMNPVAEQLTGWTTVEARDHPVWQVFAASDERTGEPADSLVTRVLREGVVVALADGVLLANREGAKRPIAATASPIRNPDGRIGGAVFVFRDRTEERLAQAMRVKSVELEAQNNHIREASRLKSEFLANMSHELRTPLNGIIGFAEILHDGRAGPVSGDQQEYLGHVLTSGRHLLQLINDVLDLSKVEAGRLEFRPEPVELDQLIREVLGVLRTTTAAKAIRVETRIAPGLAGIVLDASRFKQVLYNYVSNALKFTPEAGRVTIRVLEVSAAKFRLEVEDTGIGIATEDIDRLFVEFQQLDAGAAKRHGGTGLGLALTKRLVEAQGGEVGVRSSPGQGSVFSAILPRQALTGTPMPAAREPVPAGTTGPTVLVIEDDAHDQAALVRTLTGAGFAVDTAATGTQALTRCRDRAYDAITLDLLLPDMSGVEVLRCLRDNQHNREVPVVVVTVVTERGVVAGYPVHDLLAKPVDGPSLVAALERAGVTARRSGRVLVVDDDAGSRKLMATTLEGLDFEVDCVADGELGLQLAREAAPLAVVLDLLMPGMNGFEFLDRLRQMPSCRHIPVMIWTIKDLTVQEYARIQASVQGVIAKGGGGGMGIVEGLKLLLAK